MPKGTINPTHIFESKEDTYRIYQLPALANNQMVMIQQYTDKTFRLSMIVDWKSVREALDILGYKEVKGKKE